MNLSYTVVECVMPCMAMSRLASIIANVIALQLNPTSNSAVACDAPL
ncbi:hypothetical protein [Skermania sp. ID1734]|nr:hypothetical protein [Skermania sp. ID1734]